MAESVDATVSNTVGAIHPGSIPGPGTTNPLQVSDLQGIVIFHKAQKKHFSTKHKKKQPILTDGLLIDFT